MDVKDVINKVDENVLMSRPLNDWRSILAKECQVYACEQGYIGKRFDEINYTFCEKEEAKEIIIDNIYCLLRYKYFKKSSEEIDERIAKIVSSFTANLKSTLIKASFGIDENSDEAIKLSFIPDSCIAFKNGVFDFNKNDWLFKYDIIRIEQINNIIYSYDPSYCIQWYMNFDFEPLPFSINDLSIEDFISFMKDTTKEQKNYCFELMYNMSHDKYHNFSQEKFNHLCEILGYCCLQSFSQHFVILIGSGQNGKNSLFDGCFTNRLLPRPSSIDMETIEKDDFITGSLENKSHNIFLETDANTITKSKMIKALTGSMFQTIHQKGVQKYSGIINCKYLFAGNDKEKIKFSDNTKGFRRRINMFEIFYEWDNKEKYLKLGDYYKTSFSDDLKELKSDKTNNIIFIYFALYGIKNATKNFTSNFKFTQNDYNINYVEISDDTREKTVNITFQNFEKLSKNFNILSYLENAIYDENKQPIKKSKIFNNLGYYETKDIVNLFSNEEEFYHFFTEHDIYLSARLIEQLCDYIGSSTGFTQNLKKLYNCEIQYLYANKPYIKCSFENGKLNFK